MAWVLRKTHHSGQKEQPPAHGAELHYCITQLGFKTIALRQKYTHSSYSLQLILLRDKNSTTVILNFVLLRFRSSSKTSSFYFPRKT